MLNAAQLEKITALRRRLHACPERSGRERATMAAIRAFLEENTALDVEDMGGWLLATHREGEGFEAYLDAQRENAEALRAALQLGEET